jgi:hypothetical protein
MEFKGLNRERKDIEDFYKSKEMDKHTLAELNYLEKFFNFADRNRCFLTDRILEKRVLDFSGYRVGINLINSAIFSSKEDKGVHYINDRYIDSLYDYENLDLIISISHYSHEWYNQDCKNKFDKALLHNSSIIFYGHEHSDSDKLLTIGVGNKVSNVDISAGGIFNHHKNPNMSSYVAKFLDTSDSSVETFNFLWNKDFYKHTFISKNYVQKKISRSEKLKPSSTFMDNFLLDTKHHITSNCLDYFVFPRVIGNENEGYEDEYEICSSEDFLQEIELKKRIIIVGSENSGKSILLKHLYLSLLDSKTPLYFSAEDIKNKNISKIIKTTFEEQYSEDPDDFSKYQQITNKDKVAIIDDINFIKPTNFNNFIEHLSTEFGYIIMSTSTEWNLDIIDNVKKLLNSNDEFSKYKLDWFYADKRKQLIKSVCKSYLPKEDTEIEETVTKINNFIKNELSIFNLTPDFLIQYIIYFFNQIDTANPRNGSMFSKVFEMNLVATIKNNVVELSVDRAFMVLDRIAHYIHFNKKYPLSYTELDTIIKDYNAKYRQSIKTKTFLDELKNAKILKDFGENFEVKFVNKTILAFFVARELIKKYKNEDDHSGLNYVLDNICFGINGDIVLFISYLESNTKLLKAIYNNANNFLSDWQEYSIDKANINFLNNLTLDTKILPPTKQDKELVEEMETKTEKDIYKDEIIETVDIYDYNEADAELFVNRMIKAIKHTEMMAKILPNFEYMLDTDDIKYFVDAIYKFPNKILFHWLKFLEDNFSSIIEEIKQLNDEKTGSNHHETNELHEREIIKMLEKISISLIFSVYNGYAKYATDKNTIKVLNSHDFDQNTNYTLQNIMMLENINDIDSFIRRTDTLSAENNKKITKILLKIMVKKCLIDHENMPYGSKQHLIDKYFDRSEKLKMLISGEKHLKDCK